MCIPHLFWLTGWSAFAFAAWILALIAALVRGRVPRPLHRFLAAYVRTWMHLLCFLCVVGRQFPGFVGREGGYPIDLRIAAPVRQSRLGVLLRLVLAIPAALLASAYAGVAFAVAVLGWLAALAIGRMPGSLRDLGVAALRYQAQVNAYVFLLTWRYPDSSPVLVGRVEPSPEPTGDGAGMRAAHVAVVLAIAAGWVVAAWLLLDTAVPGDRLPRIDVDAAFGAELVEDAHRYERFLLVNWALARWSPW